MQIAECGIQIEDQLQNAKGRMTGKKSGTLHCEMEHLVKCRLQNAQGGMRRHGSIDPAGAGRIHER
jgi:hypothetical protein